MAKELSDEEDEDWEDDEYEDDDEFDEEECKFPRILFTEYFQILKRGRLDDTPQELGEYVKCFSDLEPGLSSALNSKGWIPTPVQTATLTEL